MEQMSCLSHVIIMLIQHYSMQMSSLFVEIVTRNILFLKAVINSRPSTINANPCQNSSCLVSLKAKT